MITLSDLYEIRSDPSRITVTYGLHSNRLYFGCITKETEDDDYKPIVISPAIFKTPKEAKRAMAKIVNFAMNWTAKDLTLATCPLQIFLCKSPKEYEEFCQRSASAKQPA